MVDLSQPDGVALAVNGVLQRFERRGPVPSEARELLIEISYALSESNPVETDLSPVQSVRAREIAASGIESLEHDASPAVSRRIEDALRDLAVLFSRGTVVSGVDEQARRHRARAWIPSHLRGAGADHLPWGDGTLLNEPVVVLRRRTLGTDEVWGPDGEMLGALARIDRPKGDRRRWELRDAGDQLVVGLEVSRFRSGDPDLVLSATGEEMVRLDRPGRSPLVNESLRSGDSAAGKPRRSGSTLRWLTVGGRPSGRLTVRRRLLGNSSACLEDGDQVETARITRTSRDTESSRRCFVVVLDDTADVTLRAVALFAGVLWEFGG